jgi:hypothetical protein
MGAPTDLIWGDDSYKAHRLEAALEGSKNAALRVQGMKIRALLSPPTQIEIRPFPYPGHRTCAEWMEP